MKTFLVGDIRGFTGFMQLCALAAGGEVLLTDRVHDLVRDLEGVLFIDRGVVALKGFPEPVSVYQATNRPGRPEPSIADGSPGR